jgi:predicted GNAT family acetyltransferase
MPLNVYRLTNAHREELSTLLHNNEQVNLFLLGFLEMYPIGRAWWYGVGRPLRGVVLVVPGRLAVPWAPVEEDAVALGGALRAVQQPCMMVGPRAAVDAIWRDWHGSTPTVGWFDQRLYVLTEPPTDVIPRGFRAARLSDLDVVSANGIAMEYEDLGIDRSQDLAVHRASVRERLRSRRTWVIVRKGAVVFQINVGTQTGLGCQIGGTYTPPQFRGSGLATRGVGALCQQLLEQCPRVTLHVQEQNIAAVRVYEKCGFVRSEAYRLVTV